MPIPLFTVLCGHPRLPSAGVSSVVEEEAVLRRRMLLGGGCKDARNTSGVPPACKPVCGTTRAGPAGAPQPRGGGPGAPLSPGGRGQARAGRRQAPPLPAGCSVAGRAGPGGAGGRSHERPAQRERLAGAGERGEPAGQGRAGPGGRRGARPDARREPARRAPPCPGLRAGGGPWGRGPQRVC